MTINRKFIILAGLFLLGTHAKAEDIQYDLDAGIQYFSGLDAKSLAPSSGYLLRFAAGSGPKDAFRWISSFSLINTSSSNDFDDAGATTKLSYQYLAGEFDLGLKISPLIAMSKLPIQPYFGFTGAVQVCTFNFGDISTVSATFAKTDNAAMFGYNLFVGTDIEIGKGWGFQFHVEQSNISGTIEKTTMSVSGNRYFFGLFFQ